MPKGKVCEAMCRGGGRRCPNGKAEFDPVSGKWLCHVHHPALTYRTQVKERREAKRPSLTARLDSRK